VVCQPNLALEAVPTTNDAVHVDHQDVLDVLPVTQMVKPILVPEARASQPNVVSSVPEVLLPEVEPIAPSATQSQVVAEPKGHEPLVSMSDSASSLPPPSLPTATQTGPASEAAAIETIETKTSSLAAADKLTTLAAHQPPSCASSALSGGVAVTETSDITAPHQSSGAISAAVAPAVAAAAAATSDVVVVLPTPRAPEITPVVREVETPAASTPQPIAEATSAPVHGSSCCVVM
jgi:hypothetical protein